MKNIFYVCLLTLMTGNGLHGQISKQQTWLQLDHNIKVTDSFTAVLQFWDRHYYDEVMQRDEFQLNLASSYTSGRRTKLMAGIYNIFVVRQDNPTLPSTKTDDSTEIRPWQGVSYTFASLGNGSFSSFSRLEERFIMANDGLDFDVRFREKITFKYPYKSYYGIASAEIVSNIQDDETGLMLNPYEMRNYVGAGYKFSPRVTMEASYGFFYQRKNYGANLKDSYSYGFTNNIYLLKLSFDYPAKKKREENNK